MAKIHMVLQGKGGVGKSFIASIIAQHCYAKKKDILCIDTDPVNATFYGFKKLNVTRLDLMDGDNVDPRKFDHLVEMITKSKSDVIIDNGASTFVGLSHYLISNQVSTMLREMGAAATISSPADLPAERVQVSQPGYSTASTSTTRQPAGLWKRTASPARDLSSARASGDTQLIRPRAE